MTSYGFPNKPMYPVSNPAPAPPIEERMRPLPENERRVVTRADLQNLANKTRSSLLTVTK